jgi:hypothetical protein
VVVVVVVVVAAAAAAAAVVVVTLTRTQKATDAFRKYSKHPGPEYSIYNR